MELSEDAAVKEQMGCLSSVVGGGEVWRKLFFFFFLGGGCLCLFFFVFLWGGCLFVFFFFVGGVCFFFFFVGGVCVCFLGVEFCGVLVRNAVGLLECLLNIGWMVLSCFFSLGRWGRVLRCFKLVFQGFWSKQTSSC